MPHEPPPAPLRQPEPAGVSRVPKPYYVEGVNKERAEKGAAVEFNLADLFQSVVDVVAEQPAIVADDRRAAFRRAARVVLADARRARARRDHALVGGSSALRTPAARHLVGPGGVARPSRLPGVALVTPCG